LSATGIYRQYSVRFSCKNLFRVRSSCVTKQLISGYAFLLLALLFTYPLISDVFWWGWGIGTALEAFFFASYICLGFASQSLLPRFRWIAWSVLLLTVVFVTPEALLPTPVESPSSRLWCLRAMLGCCAFLLVSTWRITRKEQPRSDS
jgi:hypothetical protein